MVFVIFEAYVSHAKASASSNIPVTLNDIIVGSYKGGPEKKRASKGY